MKRLVYVEDVMDNIDKWLDEVGSIIIDKPYSYYGALMQCIKDTPTAEIDEKEE